MMEKQTAFPVNTPLDASRQKTSADCQECDHRGVCVLHSEESIGRCGICQGEVGWISCPTGGWWAHRSHPEDGHDAQPVQTGCPAGLMPLSGDAIEGCVVRPEAGHRLHRTVDGEAWYDEVHIT